ncbi:T9SS type A sorting domain-containing protein [Hymenobacter sp. BRD128]|uniref:T9SS type A sorting domain-containing protein n=1 Tax=Hymenobacter sp. BRD128 TaxID=2675878 RepID=UPI00156520B0|nr:T9SS type A sorting domain-containing protein [Hymenobacter sp. BRD128]QKG57799.1 T9SS type A sorting domain-containing protein [Hymenobacter sp. BRD128]
MKTTTLNRERPRGRQSLFLQILLPFLALFVGLVNSYTVRAQTVSSTYYDDDITLTQKTSSSTTATTNRYAGSVYPGDTPYSTEATLGKGTPSQDLGTYNADGTSQLILNGGSIVASPPPALTGKVNVTYSITAARLIYRVYQQGTTPGTYNSVPLPANGTANGASLYSSNSANFNLLAGLTIGGKYILEVAFQTDTKGSNGTTNSDQDPATTTYQAIFTLNAPPAPTLVGTYVYIAPNGGANSVYNVSPPTPNPYQGANLGTSYDINSGILLLNGGAANTTESGANTITNVTLYYRVRLVGSGGGAFSFINLPLTSNSNGAKTFSKNSANINLIQGLPNTGNYSLDIYYQASGTNSSNPNSPVTITQTDNNNGSYYSATFTVTGTPIPSTVWMGGTNDDWFNAANWTNGVPTAGTNATIRNLGTGNTGLYPNIYSGVSYTATDTKGVKTTVDNTNSGPAMTRDLTMEGNTQSDRSILRLQAGKLNVNGNFSNPQLSFIQREYTTIDFSGTNQTISNGDFDQVVISGSGVKSVIGLMTVKQSITFTGGLLVTDITKTASSQVTLADRDPSNNNDGAQLIGETDAHYLRGFVRTTRGTTNLEEVYTYGNMGMTLKFHATSYTDPNGNALSGGNPGNVDITRNTAEAYNPVANTSGIRRIFGVRPGSPGATTGGLNADMTFHYLDSETMGLGSGGNVNIDKNNLVLFLSTNSGNTFTNLGRTSNDIVNNVVTRNAVTTFATFTLGDKNNPLPVKLVAFDAKRQGNNTLVTWATADETNNAGFEVQVSSDAKTFRKLTFVSSYSNNSVAYQTYNYTDIEAGKSGVRYYRLRQVDLDGKDSYSPVRAVSFATAAAGAVAINVYPNPSATTDQTTLVVQSPVAGQGHLQVMDLAGRTIVSRDITTLAGVTELAVLSSSELSAGIYLVKVTMPSGEVKTTRLQKR